MENKFINRYHSYCKCLDNLKKSLTANPADDFVLEGTTQNFNLTFDLSWKVLKDVLVKSMGITDFAIGSPREVLQTAFTNGLIDSDMWLQMLKCRNALAHDYDGEYAMTVFSRIITEYYRLFEKLKNTLEKYYVGDGTQADFFAK